MDYFELSQMCPFLSYRPSVLDNFALLSGQLNTINKLLRNEKTPSFRNQVIIPLVLSPDRDEDLAVSTTADNTFPLLKKEVVSLSCLFTCSQKLTEQRVPVFSHEIVPDYLRTKPDPEVEEQEKTLSTEAARIGPDVAQVSLDSHKIKYSVIFGNILHFLFKPSDFIVMNRNRSRL